MQYNNLPDITMYGSVFKTLQPLVWKLYADNEKIIEGSRKTFNR